MKRQYCMKCNRLLPYFMFRPIHKDWLYRKNPRVSNCRVCSFFHPVRYEQTFTKTGMKKLEPYKPTLRQRIEEFFR